MAGASKGRSTSIGHTILLSLAQHPVQLSIAAVNLAAALACGALIGSERQIRQRLAGLRTNALVALGSASFVTFSALFPDEVSPTRVAAQVVSGIGFLGAGIIFRDGLNVHGLNTAATLWCSAAVGLMAGAGALDFAVALTGMVVFVNLGLRPLVRFMKRHTRAGVPLLRHYAVTVTCAPTAEGQARALILRSFGVGGLRLTEVSSETRTGPDGAPHLIDLTALVLADGHADQTIEAAVHRLAAEPGLARVRWEVRDDG